MEAPGGGPARDAAASPETWVMRTCPSLAVNLSNSSASAEATARLNCFLRALSFPPVNKGNWEGLGFSSFDIKKQNKKYQKTSYKHKDRGLCSHIVFIHNVLTRVWTSGPTEQMGPLARRPDSSSGKDTHPRYPSPSSQDPLTIKRSRERRHPGKKSLEQNK